MRTPGAPERISAAWPSCPPVNVRTGVRLLFDRQLVLAEKTEWDGSAVVEVGPELE
jgi:hypothetical protein